MKLKATAMDTLKRVRWNVVFGSLVVLVVVAFLLLGNPLDPKYQGEGEIKMRAWLDPNTVGLSDESTAWVELMNLGDDEYNLTLGMSAKSRELSFNSAGELAVQKSIIIGPGESRNIPFKINVDAEYAGSYGVNIHAVYGKKEITSEMYLTVKGS
ncbi:MAG: hypothetical protein B6U72_00195 [Candidatus Altiarchaeales archaeon ex4484_2]|nr:MAG: hypothetical protein B6U72_00195 [Candidatus Altiarchaeales archaeon ex4484_2]